MNNHPTRHRMKFSDVAIGQRFYDPISEEYFVKQSANLAAMVTGIGDGTGPGSGGGTGGGVYRPGGAVTPPRLLYQRKPAYTAAALQAHARAGDADLVYPAGQKARYQKAFDRFASVFPDAFFIRERGRFFPDDSADKGRLLRAGYHNVIGYWRDDLPLQELVLDEAGHARRGLRLRPQHRLPHL